MAASLLPSRARPVVMDSCLLRWSLEEEQAQLQAQQAQQQQQQAGGQHGTTAQAPQPSGFSAVAAQQRGGRDELLARTRGAFAAAQTALMADEQELQVGRPLRSGDLFVLCQNDSSSGAWVGTGVGQGGPAADTAL